jgi:hypothetical protein
MKEKIENYKLLIDSTYKKLKNISEELSSIKPSPGKWSAKEIIGHLVDSSINNIPRFIEGQFKENLVFAGYEQDRWVNVNNYQNALWDNIVKSWYLNNIQMLRILEAIHDDILLRNHSEHNFDEIEWKEIPKTQPVNLEYLIDDYYAHMKHHLDKIFILQQTN